MRWRIVFHPLAVEWVDVQLMHDNGTEMPEPDSRSAGRNRLGLEVVATLSNGTQFQPKVPCDQRLRWVSRSLSKAKPGSISRGSSWAWARRPYAGTTHGIGDHGHYTGA